MSKTLEKLKEVGAKCTNEGTTFAANTVDGVLGEIADNFKEATGGDLPPLPEEAGYYALRYVFEGPSNNPVRKYYIWKDVTDGVIDAIGVPSIPIPSEISVSINPTDKPELAYCLTQRYGGGGYLWGEVRIPTCTSIPDLPYGTEAWGEEPHILDGTYKLVVTGGVPAWVRETVE